MDDKIKKDIYSFSGHAGLFPNEYIRGNIVAHMEKYPDAQVIGNPEEVRLGKNGLLYEFNLPGDVKLVYDGMIEVEYSHVEIWLEGNDQESVDRAEEIFKGLPLEKRFSAGGVS